MRVARTPVLLGLLAGLAGLALLGQGWSRVAGGEVGAAGAASLGLGAALAVLGALMVVVPLLVPMLYRLYGEQAFSSRGGACPVVAKCGRCGEFTFRGKPRCKACGAALQAEPA